MFAGKKINSLSTLNRHKLNPGHKKRKQTEPSNEKKKQQHTNVP